LQFSHERQDEGQEGEREEQDPEHRTLHEPSARQIASDGHEENAHQDTMVQPGAQKDKGRRCKHGGMSERQRNKPHDEACDDRGGQANSCARKRSHAQPT
jgi:hypothetical protein